MWVLDEWPDFVHRKHMKFDFVERRDDPERDSNYKRADHDKKSPNVIK